MSVSCDLSNKIQANLKTHCAEKRHIFFFFGKNNNRKVGYILRKLIEILLLRRSRKIV